MIKAILLTIIVIFAALGICEFFYTITSAFLHSGVKTSNYCIILLKCGHSADQLRYFAHKFRWYGDEYCKRIIAVKDNIDEKEIADCERYCYGTNIYLCDFSEILSVINSFETGVTNGEEYISRNTGKN